MSVQNLRQKQRTLSRVLAWVYHSAFEGVKAYVRDIQLLWTSMRGRTSKSFLLQRLDRQCDFDRTYAAVDSEAGLWYSY